MADLSITKQAAAQRQIDAAIRMLFLHGEDFIAIHTVAAAARTILNDLAEARGVGETHNTPLVVEFMYRYNYGLDPTDHAVESLINHTAKAIEKDPKTKTLRNQTANFLKHADRDPRESLDFGELNPCWVILDCLILWNNLDLDISGEMFVYGLWWNGVNALRPENVLDTASGPVHLLTFDQQLALGRDLLKCVYRDKGRFTDHFRDDTAHGLGPARKYPGADEAETAGEDMDGDSKDRAIAVAEQIWARVEAKAQTGVSGTAAPASSSVDGGHDV
jgi:hypothetical protein